MMRSVFLFDAGHQVQRHEFYNRNVFGNLVGRTVQ